jgi:hypothetical protein
MRILAIIAALLLSAVSAHAQRQVIGGKPFQLAFFVSTNPDCSARGYPTISVTQQPQHGRVRVAHGSDFASFSAANPRSACNRRRLAGTGITYVSERGYTGFDTVGIEVIFPSGRHGRGFYNLNVR